MPIPRTIHIVWIGDESQRPDRYIDTWRHRNPGFVVRVWGNDDLRDHAWWLGVQMQAWYPLDIRGTVDLMRWEILSRYGGITMDADSECVRPLEDWLLEPDCFASWENEIARPALIANGTVGSVPGHPLISQIVRDILDDPDLYSGEAWQRVGPGRLTDTVHKYKYSGLTIYPSHYFQPVHYSGQAYTGSGPVFARQEWAATREVSGMVGLRRPSEPVPVA